MGLFCRKWPIKIRHPMGLCHPVVYLAASWLSRIFTTHCLLNFKIRNSQKTALRSFYTVQGVVSWLSRISTTHSLLNFRTRNSQKTALRSFYMVHWGAGWLSRISITHSLLNWFRNQKFLKDSCTFILYGTLSSKLTFENFYPGLLARVKRCQKNSPDSSLLSWLV